MTIKTRKLGEAGPPVSELGFGAWALGGQWGNSDDAESIAVLHAAVDRGIRFVDTSATDSDGQSERMIGAVLKDRADEMFVATKSPPAAGPFPPSPYCRWQDRYSAAYLRENVHERLRNLSVERLDLLQLQSWSRAWNDDPQPLLVLRQLRDEGKVNLIGVCPPEQDQTSVIELMRNGLVDVVQVIFNLFDQEAACQLLQVAEETGTGVIVRAALDEGSLTGTYKPEHVFAEHDFRSRYFAGDRMQRALARVQAIREDVQAAGLADTFTLSDVALKFVLARTEVSTAIVGMRTTGQLETIARVSELPDLPQDFLLCLQRHNWRRGIWYSGK